MFILLIVLIKITHCRTYIKWVWSCTDLLRVPPKLNDRKLSNDSSSVVARVRKGMFQFHACATLASTGKVGFKDQIFFYIACTKNKGKWLYDKNLWSKLWNLVVAWRLLNFSTFLVAGDKTKALNKHLRYFSFRR